MQTLAQAKAQESTPFLLAFNQVYKLKIILYELQILFAVELCLELIKIVRRIIYLSSTSERTLKFSFGLHDGDDNSKQNGRSQPCTLKRIIGKIVLHNILFISQNIHGYFIFRIYRHPNHFVSYFLQNLLNLFRNSSILLMEQLIVSRIKVYSLLKNLPGKIITFSYAYSFLQNQMMLANYFLSSFSIFIKIVAQRAPDACPTTQQSYYFRLYCNSYLFFPIFNIFSCKYSSFFGFSNIYFTDACITVLGIKIILKMLRSDSQYFLQFSQFEQTMSQPNLHPGPSHLLVRPEHLKMVTSSVASYAKVREGSPQVTPSQIQSAKRGIFFLRANSIIWSLCYSGQQVPNGLEGSFTKINFVLSSINDSIYCKLAFHQSLGLR